jgi:hypothetical protein
MQRLFAHIIETRGDSLPQDQYSQCLMGRQGWGSRENIQRTEKKAHKVFHAGVVGGLKALNGGQYSPQTSAAGSPEPLAVLLSNPSRKRRMEIRPSPLAFDTFSSDSPGQSK